MHQGQQCRRLPRQQTDQQAQEIAGHHPATGFQAARWPSGKRLPPLQTVLPGVWRGPTAAMPLEEDLAVSATPPCHRTRHLPGRMPVPADRRWRPLATIAGAMVQPPLPPRTSPFPPAKGAWAPVLMPVRPPPARGTNREAQAARIGRRRATPQALWWRAARPLAACARMAPAAPHGVPPVPVPRVPDPAPLRRVCPLLAMRTPDAEVRWRGERWREQARVRARRDQAQGPARLRHRPSAAGLPLPRQPPQPG